ncbi:hypothetical protein EXE58_06755 [Nocardioides seonyuensis]|uniref:Uncharacterized protein n=1 Tax=Nocardioides seonyuensis TaxID=2518371 RepID=A0A4V1BM54_9ACTN|nr:hypothetical protein [Nocardioides seonyuensis]QBX55182.1 hypothetical protein EXE58_06755 [Nocardioides seonyuensis]
MTIRGLASTLVRTRAWQVCAGAFVLAALIGIGRSSHPIGESRLPGTLDTLDDVAVVLVPITLALVLGTLNDARFEETLHLTGHSPRRARLQVLVLLLGTIVLGLVLVWAVCVATSRADAVPRFMPLEPATMGLGDVARPVLTLLASFGCSMALALHRSTVDALLGAAALVSVHLLLLLGKPLPAIDLVRAAWPTTAAAVVALGGPFAGLAVVSLLATMVVAALTSIGAPGSDPGSSGERSRPAPRPARARRLTTRSGAWRTGALVASGIALGAATLPSLAESVPADRRLSTIVQEQRRESPRDAATSFFRLTNGGDTSSAAKLTVSHDTARTFVGVPVLLGAQQVTLTPAGSRSIRRAQVDGSGGGLDFSVCLIRRPGQWLVEEVTRRGGCAH